MPSSCGSFLVRLLFRHPMAVHKTAAQYLDLLRSAGFAVHPERVSNPDPFWSRPDGGLLERLGFGPKPPREPRQLDVVALRPGGGAS